MSNDIAANEEIFDVIREFQAKRCGRPFCAKYGALGTGIGWQIKQKTDGGPRVPMLCLRVFVRAKKDKPPKPLRKSFPYKGIDIPVDVCEAIPSLHSALIPSSEHTASGFEAQGPQLPLGALGSWAWHRETDSLVLLSCWHVLGDRPSRASNSLFEPPVVAHVRSGVRVVGGKRTNLVDCAFADPVWKSITNEKFLERIPPVLASGAPSARRTPVSRYQPWHVQGGTISGVVDAVSVEMYIPYGARRCWFTDLFLVQREEGAWGAPSDSGSLIFGRDPIGPNETRPALGVYMGGFDEGIAGKRRMLGIACRMDHVAAALGVEFVGGQPIFAFLDSLLDREAPLDFLAHRRGSRTSVISRRGWSEALVNYMKVSGGKAVVGPLKRQRHVVVGLLVSDESIRKAAARALRPLLLSGETPEAVFAHVLTSDERSALLALIELLRTSEVLRVRGALEPYEAAVKDPDRRTVGDVLRFVDELAPDYAAMV